MKTGKQLKPADIDVMEAEVFQRICNTNKHIALDSFHTRLVDQPNRKRQGLNKGGR